GGASDHRYSSYTERAYKQIVKEYRYTELGDNRQINQEDNKQKGLDEYRDRSREDLRQAGLKDYRSPVYGGSVPSRPDNNFAHTGAEDLEAVEMLLSFSQHDMRWNSPVCENNIPELPPSPPSSHGGDLSLSSTRVRRGRVV
ncbi:hypothetical protein OTU49_009230, partial [Cherax quadricarinatus]